VIRISISSAAFNAIKATLPLGAAAYEPQRTAQGDFFIWIERSWLNKLEALRQPGEALSETIVRLVAMEGGGRPRRRGAELFGPKSRPAPRGARARLVEDDHDAAPRRRPCGRAGGLGRLEPQKRSVRLLDDNVV
jgi:hypothetical protein